MPVTQSTILPLRYGEFMIAYHRMLQGDCVSIRLGDVQNGVPIVRIHSSCLFGESLGALDCDCADQLVSSLKLIRRNRSGVVVYRYAEGRGVGLENKIKALELQRTRHLNTVEAFRQLGFEPDARTYEAEVLALKELEVSANVKVATQNPQKLAALRSSGFTVMEQVHPAVRVTKYNVQELMTKKLLLGYNISIPQDVRRGLP